MGEGDDEGDSLAGGYAEVSRSALSHSNAELTRSLSLLAIKVRRQRATSMDSSRPSQLAQNLCSSAPFPSLVHPPLANPPPRRTWLGARDPIVAPTCGSLLNSSPMEMTAISPRGTVLSMRKSWRAPRRVPRRDGGKVDEVSSGSEAFGIRLFVALVFACVVTLVCAGRTQSSLSFGEGMRRIEAVSLGCEKLVTRSSFVQRGDLIS